MPRRASSEGLLSAPPAPSPSPPSEEPAWLLPRTVLRGVGQVVFQGNALAGALFLAGVTWGSISDGVAALAGALVGTLGAWLLGAERQPLDAGLYGFNGTLVALGLVHFLGASGWVWALALGLAALSTFVTASLMRVCGRAGVPALTAPFVLTTWAGLLAAQQLARLTPPLVEVPSEVAPEALALTGKLLLEGGLRGLGEIFFQDDVVAGGLIALGLLVGSRVAGLAGALGALLGLLVGFGFGAAPAALTLGLYGFNSALAAVATVTFLRLELSSVVTALLAAVAAALVYAALGAALAPVGVGALTAPFVLVVWAVLLGRPLLPALRAPEPPAA